MSSPDDSGVVFHFGLGYGIFIFQQVVMVHVIVNSETVFFFERRSSRRPSVLSQWSSGVYQGAERMKVTDRVFNGASVSRRLLSL